MIKVAALANNADDKAELATRFNMVNGTTALGAIITVAPARDLTLANKRIDVMAASLGRIEQ